MTNANPYEIKTVQNVLTEFSVHPSEGLPLAEIPVRQTTYGLNAVPEKRPSMLLLFGKHFWGLSAFMLEFTIVISYFLHKYVDVYLITGLMLFNGVMGFLQELKASRTVRALKSSLEVMVRVLRAGQWKEVGAKQLVPGDIVRFRTGDFVTADAKVVSGEASADESALTGESLHIDKQEGNVVYAGSSIKSGECTAVVVSTGIKTYFGKTAELIRKAKPHLHMDEVVGNVVKITFSLVLILMAAIFTLS